MAFNLWERSLTINVKNLWLQHTENTVFTVKDYKWTEQYKWTYFVPDIKTLEKWELKLNFHNLHCAYNLDLKVNPNNFHKNIDIKYMQDSTLQCKIDVKPESVKETMQINVKNIDDTLIKISLNDLSFRHFLWIFVFWVFLTITLMIRRMDKKWLLLNNRDK